MNDREIIKIMGWAHRDGMQAEAMRSAWRAKALAQRRARFGHQDQIEMFGEAAR